MDESSNKRAGRIGVVLQSPQGDIIECAVRLQFSTTNNEAEYEAILTRLDLAKAVGPHQSSFIATPKLSLGISIGIMKPRANQWKSISNLLEDVRIKPLR